MKKLPYHEGSCIAVPLRIGGYGIGVVARMAPRGKIILVYFFGTKYENLPILTDINHLQSSKAIKCLRIGDLGLMTGKWPVIGDLPNWEKKSWPMPAFLRSDELSKRAWRTIYSDSNPAKLEREEPIPYDFTGLEENSLCGAGYVEELMTQILT